MSVLQMTCACSAFIIFITSISVVEGCSCGPAHPQDMFCTADFVIKAKIKKSRLVDLYPDGTFRRLKNLNTGHPETHGVTEQERVESGVGEDESETNIEHRERPEPHYRLNAVGPDMNMPGYHDGPPRLAETHNVVDPPGYSTINGAFRQKRSPLVIPPIVHQPGEMPGPPGIHEIIATPQPMVMLQYRVVISKIYKGFQNSTKLQQKYVYTSPSSSLCGAKLPTNRTPLLLMGYFWDGTPSIELCDYKLDLTKLDEDQRKNVIRNMEHRYPANCQKCNVEVCIFGECENEKAPNQCRWTEWWSSNSPFASQFACVPGKSGKCHWYDAISKEIKPEDIDDWTR